MVQRQPNQPRGTLIMINRMANKIRISNYLTFFPYLDSSRSTPCSFQAALSPNSKCFAFTLFHSLFCWVQDQITLGTQYSDRKLVKSLCSGPISGRLVLEHDDVPCKSLLLRLTYYSHIVGTSFSFLLNRVSLSPWGISCAARGTNGKESGPDQTWGTLPHTASLKAANLPQFRKR